MTPYAEALRAFSRAGVRYVVVGAMGANLYAKNAGVVITTADCDVLLPAKPRILAKCIRILLRLGFELEAGREPLPVADPAMIRGIVRARGCVRATRKNENIDLPLAIAGCSFAKLWKTRRRFRLGGVPVNVAPLSDILRSKELAGRPKDRLFLATHRDALEQLLGRDVPKKKRARRKSRRSL